MTAWTLLPDLVVRSAGFPWHLTRTLAWPRTAEAGESISAAHLRLDALHARLAPRSRPTRGQLARLRNRRVLEADAPVPDDWRLEWNEAVAVLEAAREQAAGAAAADEAAVGEAVRAMLADARFLDAVVCSGPGVYRDLLRGRDGSTRVRRQIASYAQRLSAKCETMSFFGPINYATLDAAHPGNGEPVWEGGTACAGRRAHLAAWAYDRLRDAVLHDPAMAGLLVPRRKTFAGTPSAGACGPALAALLAGADGSRSLRRIAAGAGVTDAEAAEALAAGIGRGLLACDLLPDAVTADPTRALAERLPEHAACTGPVRTAVRLLDRYPSATPQEKLALQEELTAIAPPPEGDATRGRGKFYNDRVVVHEAAVGTLGLTVGGQLAADLRTAVPAALDLLAHAAVRTRLATNRTVARTLGAGRFPLVRAMRACAELPVTADPWLHDTLRNALAGLPPDAVEADLAGSLPTPPAPDLPVLCSADVMVAAGSLAEYRSGVTPLVVGDIHDAPLLTPWALQFHPDAAGALARRDAGIERALGDVRTVSVVARRTSGLPPLRYPGPLLELGPVTGPGERVRLDRLFVHSDGETAHLRADGAQEDLHFHNGELDSALHTAFALPRVRPPALPDLPYLPRLRWGNVVFARRRWRLDPEALLECARPAAWADRLLAVRRLAAERDWPTAFFAKSPRERKPVYVDLTSPSLLDGLFRLAKDAPLLRATEVLPDGRQLWLRDADQRFAAEFRCVYLRPAADPAADGEVR